MNSSGSLEWRGLSYTRGHPPLPELTFMKHSFHPHVAETDFPGSYFKVQVLKAASWWEMSQHIPHKGMNLRQLKSVQQEADEGGGSCAHMCVHPHDNSDGNMHFLMR